MFFLCFFTGEDFSPTGALLVLGTKVGLVAPFVGSMRYHYIRALVWGWYILHPWNLRWTPDTQNCSVFFVWRYLLPSQCTFGIKLLFPVVLRPVRQKHRSKNRLVSLLVCVHTTWEENMNIGGTQWQSKWFGSPDYCISPSNSKWNINK